MLSLGILYMLHLLGLFLWILFYSLILGRVVHVEIWFYISVFYSYFSALFSLGSIGLLIICVFCLYCSVIFLFWFWDCLLWV